MASIGCRRGGYPRSLLRGRFRLWGWLRRPTASSPNDIGGGWIFGGGDFSESILYIKLFYKIQIGLRLELP